MLVIDQLMTENASLMKIVVIMQQGVAMSHFHYSSKNLYSMNLGLTNIVYDTDTSWCFI